MWRLRFLTANTAAEFTFSLSHLSPTFAWSCFSLVATRTRYADCNCARCSDLSRQPKRGRGVSTPSGLVAYSQVNSDSASSDDASSACCSAQCAVMLARMVTAKHNVRLTAIVFTCCRMNMLCFSCLSLMCSSYCVTTCIILRVPLDPFTRDAKRAVARLRKKPTGPTWRSVDRLRVIVVLRRHRRRRLSPTRCSNRFRRTRSQSARRGWRRSPSSGDR